MALLPRRWTLLGLLLVIGAAALFRLWQIGSLPPGFHLDESYEGLEAWRILSDPTYRPIFLEGNFGVAPLNAWANALTFGVGGWLGVAPGPTLMRVTAALFGVLGVAAVWWLARELALQGRVRNESLIHLFPLFAAASLAVMRWHVHFSRMGIEPVLMPLQWALATALLLHALRTGRWLAWVGLGIALAAPMYTYQGAWHYPIVIGLTALILLFAQRGDESPMRRRTLLGMVGAGALALLLVSPLLLYLLRNPDLALLRPAQISVVGETSSPADSGVLATTWQTLRMFWPFGATGDIDPRRNIPGEPALPLALALPFFIGIGVALRRVREPMGWIPLLALPSLLLVGFVSEYAPHFHRVLGAAAPVALLCGLGLHAIAGWAALLLRRAGQPTGRSTTVGAVLATGLLVWAAFVGARDYFVRWAALPDLYHAFDEGLWQVGQWVADQPAGMPVYLSPRSADHSTLAFAWETASNAQGPPVTFDGRSIFPLTDGSAPTPERYVSITHEDYRTPLLMPGLLPDASVVNQWNDRTGAPYATAWERPMGQSDARPPRRPLEVALGDRITLIGYDVQPEVIRPGEVLYLQLHWLVGAPPATEWTVFTHVLNPATPDAPPLAGKDSPPGGGSLPTTRWKAGWRVLDEYQIGVPGDLPPGDYALATGLYTADGAHLPTTGPIALGTVTIEAP